MRSRVVRWPFAGCAPDLTATGSLLGANVWEMASLAEGTQPWWSAKAVDGSLEGVRHARAAACRAHGRAPLHEDRALRMGGGDRAQWVCKRGVPACRTAGLALSLSSRRSRVCSATQRALRRPPGLRVPCSGMGQLLPAPVAGSRRWRPSSVVANRPVSSAPRGHRAQSVGGASVKRSWPQRPLGVWAAVEGIGP
jgi:hypothetical protein